MLVVKKDTGRIYAMKVLRKETIIAADAVQHTLSETNVLRRINHPFIVGLKYSFQSPDKLYMVMDYLSGGELFHHLSNVDRFSEDRARFYAAEIVEALGYLHEQGVVYRFVYLPSFFFSQCHRHFFYFPIPSLSPLLLPFPLLAGLLAFDLVLASNESLSFFPLFEEFYETWISN